MVVRAWKRLLAALCHVKGQVIHELIINLSSPSLVTHKPQVGCLILGLLLSLIVVWRGTTCNVVRLVITVDHLLSMIGISLFNDTIAFLPSKLSQLVLLQSLEFEFSHYIVSLLI